MTLTYTFILVEYQQWQTTVGAGRDHGPPKFLNFFFILYIF